MATLTCSGLSKSFGGLKAVQNVSFDASGGRILSVIGPNGAGKTTVFNLLTGFLKEDAGEVLLDGRSLSGLSPERRCRAGLARTFQVVQPFRGLDVLENVTMGALVRAGTVAEARDHAAAVLESLGMLPLARARAGSLPIGDRKRLEVAKVLATRPSVLLLDEVMGGLIPVEIGRMIDFIRRLRDDGLAIVVIEHHMRAVMSLSDEVLVLQHGQPIARGTPQEISRNPDVLAAYLGPNFALAEA